MTDRLPHAEILAIFAGLAGRRSLARGLLKGALPERDDANGNPTATTNRVTLGICNDSNVSIQGRLNVKYTGTGSSGAWSPFSYTAISAGAKWRWLKRSYNNYPPCTPDPEGVCLSLYPYPSYYRVDAYGPAGKIFHMTSGIYVVDQDNCVVK